ncbi:redoxin domain-containing protein [Kordiimonas sp. SCSIO 12603]|uniref:redoxin domain-containing protein n=1 Tax=Kordiimonas sp. SCSIO 12603 TaxID=2829596 RepID=UPI0021033C49|nr:redoxin domain-containing protein [Kordiimonas sp. SCSIO 12603]UTW57384.1 redoxin domain-containing protein [Kordiimonas sp. SCSIO 12603]
MRGVILTYLFILASMTSPIMAQPVVGEKAPAFIGLKSNGDTINLEDLKGSYVVLEWTNHECPYVKKHYNSGNMQKTQESLTSQGVHWISVISSAPGKQGHVSASEATEIATKRGSYATSIVLDPSGEIGRAYRAKTTPQMVLIDPEGDILYQGAIDNKPSARISSLEGASNYLLTAWNEVRNGEQVSVRETKPYGCTIKYGDTQGYK